MIFTKQLGTGETVSVGPKDRELLMAHNWTRHKGRHTYYASRLDFSSGKTRRVYLHREILRAAKGIQVDHRNGDGLYNLRSNLRPATNAQNHAGRMNRPAHFRSRFRGVYFNRPGNNWCGQIKVNYKKSHLGVFDNQEDAARAYDAAATKAFGKFAQLNFPNG